MGYLVHLATLLLSWCILNHVRPGDAACLKVNNEVCDILCPCEDVQPEKPAPTESPTPTSSPITTAEAAPTDAPTVGSACASDEDCRHGHSCSCSGKCAKTVRLFGAFSINDNGIAYINCKRIGRTTHYPTHTRFQYEGPCGDVIFWVRNLNGTLAGVVLGAQDLDTRETFGTGRGSVSAFLGPPGNFVTDGSYDFSHWSKARVQIHNQPPTTQLGALADMYGAFPEVIEATKGVLVGFRYPMPCDEEPEYDPSGRGIACNVEAAVARCAQGPGPECSLGDIAWLQYTACHSSGIPHTRGCDELRKTHLVVAGQVVSRDMKHSCHSVCIMQIACSMPRGEDPHWMSKCAMANDLAASCAFSDTNVSTRAY